MKKYIIRVFLVIILYFFASNLYADVCGYKELKKINFIRENQTIAQFDSGVADNEDLRTRGLMFCNSLKKGTGLFFIFDFPASKAFWMKNTSIPLGLIFVSADLKVLSVQHGIPFSLEHIVEQEPVKFVLEVNHDESLKIQKGDRISIGNL
ncbi:MAG: DUF192 domain-containing protein [Desulfobacterales bacterium]|nr:DUF192 domain-containing protein [Desulfobacterales bacterium]MCP4159281.1 DUF192 domain-containing protein [Deltaproteobacteria bacterium]